MTEAFTRLVQDHLDGFASEADVALLAAHEEEWIRVLRRLLARADEALARVRANVHGPERALVLEDFGSERDRIRAVLAEVSGAPVEPPGDAAEETATAPARPAGPATPQLQLSWTRGHVVAWAAGRSGAEPADAVRARLRDAGAPDGAWSEHRAVRLPTGDEADALVAPIPSTLGWLVALGSADRPVAPAADAAVGDGVVDLRADGDAAEGEPSPDAATDAPIGASAAWLGLVAGLAVRLAAAGRMVPQVQKGTPTAPPRPRGGRATFAVRWSPALLDQEELAALAGALPGAVAVLDQRQDPKAFTRAVVADLLHAVCRDAASRIEVPAPPPSPRSAQEVAEAVLARLDGEPFDAPEDRGSEVARALQQWAGGVTTGSRPVLTLQLDPPDAEDVWHVRTLVAGGARRPDPIGQAVATAPGARRQALRAELERLEALYPPLKRGSADRRGEVVLVPDEAWELMASVGPVLVAAGFDVRVPPISRRRPTAGLRLTSVEAQGTVVGTQQLTTVRWSAVFDDVELTAQDILRLAAQSRPLIKARGRWVELDRADLEAAAAALEERRDRTALTGADMLRYALGLDGSPLPGGTTLAGEGWAADLLRAAGDIPEHPPTHLEGFSGELRGYQADALAWLEFLADAGLGGCLALDMGLGKTPVVLAQLRRSKGGRPALVIAPPAVVGNWAAEAGRFVPDLRVVVHHGTNRAEHDEVARAVDGADVLLTTYGTAVRDIDALEDIAWSTVVLDEAQVIKNATSDTAQQLRRLSAGIRLALTGTPIENGLGDLWALLDFVNPGLVGDRASFVNALSRTGGGARTAGEAALRTLNGVLVFRRTKSEPSIAAELPDRIDELDHCPMTPEQIGLYQAVLDDLVAQPLDDDGQSRKGAVLAAITALKQICNHPLAYTDDGGPMTGRSGKLARLDEILDNVFAAGERMLIFTHFATWGERLSKYLTDRSGVRIACYHGGLARGARDRLVREFQDGTGPGALVLSLKAGGTGLNLTAASHVVLYDRWWNPAVEDQARDRAWRIGQTRTVIAHRLVCPGTVDERVEEVVAGKRRIANLVLPESSSVGDLHAEQLQAALGLDRNALLTEDDLEQVRT